MVYRARRLAGIGGLVLAAGVAVGAPALADAAASGATEWSIDPPAGWHEDAAAARMIRQKLDEAGARFAKADFHVWVPAVKGVGLTLQWYVLDADGTSERQIDEYDRGMVSGFAHESTLDNRPQQIVGSMVIRDVRVEQLRGLAVQARMVRRYQPAADGLHVLIAMCTATADIAPCNAAIDGIRFTVPDAEPLRAGAGREHDAAYRAGYVIGKVALPVLALWILYRIVRRGRRKREVTAAAPPGSPPGPGGAAGGM